MHGGNAKLISDDYLLLLMLMSMGNIKIVFKKVRETASKISKTLKSQEKRHFGLKLTWRAGI